MSEPTTATGRKLVAIHGYALLDDVLGIESEATAAARAEVAPEIRRIFTVYGYDRHEPFCVPARECTCRHNMVDAVLALLEDAAPRQPEPEITDLGDRAPRRYRRSGEVSE